MDADVERAMKRVAERMARVFPTHNAWGARIVYGPRDCCAPGAQGYGPHERWCRHYSTQTGPLGPTA